MQPVENLKKLSIADANKYDQKKKEINESINPSPGRKSMFYTQSHNGLSKRRNNSSSPGG